MRSLYFARIFGGIHQSGAGDSANLIDHLVFSRYLHGWPFRYLQEKLILTSLWTEKGFRFSFSLYVMQNSIFGRLSVNICSR